jgi:hypothetical protein
MRHETNIPFRPGAGRVPPVLSGRSSVLEAFDRTLKDMSASGEGDRPWVLSGLRGVGKTVLLNEFTRRAKQRDWITVKVEASPGVSLAGALANGLYRPLRDTKAASEKAGNFLKRAIRVFSSFQIKVDPTGATSFGFDVEPERGVADSGVLSVDLLDLLETLGEAARALEIGVLLTVDELQDTPQDDLRALNMALHELGQSASPVPVFFVGAGLPSLPAVLADATSYAERLYDYRTIGLLDDQATREALVLPLKPLGVAWDPAALNLVVKVSKGYPYLVQTCGKHVWDALTDQLSVTTAIAQTGILHAQREVDEGLYRSRWERATPRQRQLLVAMAEDGEGPSSISVLAERVGKKRTSNLSVPRRDLISGGHVYAPERGYLAFTVPGMADFINRESDI